jgi:hypothetical protein
MSNKAVSVATSVGWGILSVIVTILVVFNFLSGIAGGIWLAIRGEWGSIGWGFLLAIVMPWVWTFASLPAMGMTLLVVRFAERRNRVFTAVFGFLSSLYSNALVALWVIVVFGFFLKRSAPDSRIVYLLWGYSAMMAPLSYMASKEPPGSTGTSLGLLCAQLSFFFLSLLWYLGTELRTIIVALSLVAVCFSLFAMFLSITSEPSSNSVEESDPFHGEF